MTKQPPPQIDKTKPVILGPDEPGPRLEEIDDSTSGRFKPASKLAWVPGKIEVVFEVASLSGVHDWDFSNEGARKEFAKDWTDELTALLKTNKLRVWKPSFPLRYPWSPEESDEKAIEKYREAGRDRFVTFTFPRNANVRRIAHELRALPEISRAVPMPRMAPPAPPPNEPLTGESDQLADTVCRNGRCLQNQWYIFRCSVDQAWNSASGRGVTIADVDWGFAPDHQDLANRIRQTQNVIPGLSPVNVRNGNRCDHGNAALGLAGAEVNSLGMAGIAFEADLWAIQGGTEQIDIPDLWVAGIHFVHTQQTAGRKVIILEVQTANGGNVEMSPMISEEIMIAIRENVVVCVPAGNAGLNAAIGDDGCPIPPTGSILVGATRYDPLLNIRGGSNGGCRVTVYAPGDAAFDLTCGLQPDCYRNGFGGTSGAVAKVAGVVALMLEKDPTLAHADVRRILAQSQIPVVDDPGNRVGVLLNAEQAVSEAMRRANGHCPG